MSSLQRCDKRFRCDPEASISSVGPGGQTWEAGSDAMVNGGPGGVAVG